MSDVAVLLGHHGGAFAWDEECRSKNRAELDGYYAHLYGLTRDELRYVLDPTDVFGEDFPSETFRVLKEKGEKDFGEYRTRRLVLEAFDKLAESPRFRDDMPKRESAFKVAEVVKQRILNGGKIKCHGDLPALFPFPEVCFFG